MIFQNKSYLLVFDIEPAGYVPLLLLSLLMLLCVCSPLTFVQILKLVLVQTLLVFLLPSPVLTLAGLPLRGLLRLLLLHLRSLRPVLGDLLKRLRLLFLQRFHLIFDRIRPALLLFAHRQHALDLLNALGNLHKRTLPLMGVDFTVAIDV